MQYEPSSSIFPSLMREELSCTPAQVPTSAVGEADISPVATSLAAKSGGTRRGCFDPSGLGRVPKLKAGMRISSKNGNIDDASIPDHVDVPHEETDDTFVNRLIDSESESENESDFGDNGYVDPTSSS